MQIKYIDIDKLVPDDSNPRKTDPYRMHLLKISIEKLGFILPLSVTESGLVLSGHQRLVVAKELGYTRVPCHVVSIQSKDIKGINILYNRATNDFSAMDTGSSSLLVNVSLTEIMEEAGILPSIPPDSYEIDCKVVDIRNLGTEYADQYDKKAVVLAENFIRKGIRIPIVVSESGKVVNGVFRLFAARENGINVWPVITIPDDMARFATHFLNYLSMDYHVDNDFAQVLRYSAYRRPQNNRGSVPKAYRFWANGERTLLDKDSYSTDYWRNFRDLHGKNIVDFGSGLSKVSTFLNTKGFDCIDFEPYRIDLNSDNKKPDYEYSVYKAKEFLQRISDESYVPDSIFLASVLNSVPFPRDRMAVLAIVHSLCSFSTTVYGTCRDISDFNYEYGGIRQANYFVFDSEPGVRLGDALHNPKLQKFHSQEEVDGQLSYFWSKRDYWKGGNIFYFRCKNPKRFSSKVLSEALGFEFNLPYSNGKTMGLVEEAKKSFGKRLKVKL